MCETKVISQAGESVISRCAECRCIFIWHNSLILSFSTDQFIQFRDFASELNFEQHCFPFPDGEERIVMRTPVNDIQLTFTPVQWEDFHTAMDEAACMQQVYDLMEGE
ncbi:MAG TPA: DUF6686 family protein [Mucilaginibacter sp.]|nr:DUF6686 family protein [Mucilaginibacter sp.]